MLQLNWNSTTITTNRMANNMLKLFKETAPTVGAFDTETNGLHIILSTPFLFQFGWIDSNGKDGYTFVVDLERQPKLAHAVISAWVKMVSGFDIILAHNVKFDMHMLTNIGYEYPVENLSDTMFYIRYAHDSIPPSAGGPVLGLKEYTTQYITPQAKTHENKLKKEKSAIAKELNLKLKQRLKNCGTPPPHFKAKSYTLGVLQCMFKDVIFDYTKLPEHVKSHYLEWIENDVPPYLRQQVLSAGLVESDMIPYNILNRENLIEYAHYDIIYVLETYLKLDPVIKARENYRAVEIENSLIFPLYEMERIGFQTDKSYLQSSQSKLKQYIIERRERLYELAQQEISIGQHDLIKNILYNEFDITVNSTGKAPLNNLRNSLVRAEEDHSLAIEFIDIIQELRTLEKWYATYLTRFLNELKDIDRLYTQISQVGAVSGRVSSDFQQFPRKPIKDIHGQELFHPRRMVIPEGEEYNALVYIDYSQIELRKQALYTILIGSPDTNLCRAFMPYNCKRVNDHADFDYNNPEHIANYDQYKWYLKEDQDVIWEPIDLHGVMAFEISGLKPGDPGFDEARFIGKTTNFAKNYGAQWGCIRDLFPDKTKQEITTIDQAYYKSFPGVKHYHNYCYQRAGYSNTTNLFGVKYYNTSGHKLMNLLVQGSAAYFLKLKIREIYDYTKKHGIKSRFQMNIHDELSWERHKDETDVFFTFKEIMEDWPDTLIPIVADVSASTTTWADKQEVSTIEELRIHLST